jgi:4-amino-4-deoxy-L-arabinose transferase-like glycosyltransferase
MDPLVIASILTGAVLTLATAYSLGLLLFAQAPVPAEIVLAGGAVVESTVIFLLLLTHQGHWRVFLIVGALSLVLARVFSRRQPLDPLRLQGRIRIAAVIVFGAYGLWYFVNALAPEVLTDGVTYHLGLPARYIQLRGFPNRIMFYDMFPQGMEMLYTAAFAFGRHSAAKLVEFGFFVATLPLIFRIARRLRTNDLAGLTAAVCYFCAPVSGVTGSSSYNDAAEVFFALASLYLLLAWRDTSDSRYLLPAGLLAGFCCAIKLPGAFAIVAATLLVLARGRFRAAAVVAAGCALAIAPWLIRNAVVSGNPAAPFLNEWFPNPWFHTETEKQLSATLGSLGSIRASELPWQLAFGGNLQGTFGPVLLALPIGLWALRRAAGRLLWGAALILACPWYFDKGARFLMPAVACATLALAMTLPRPAAWAMIVLQAVLCWPNVMNLLERRHSFRVDAFPVAAALRIIPESEYLRQRVESYSLAQLIERETRPGAKVLALTSVAEAYSTRDIRVWWQSAEGDRMAESLGAAAFSSQAGLFAWKADWPAESIYSIRVSVPANDAAEFDVADLSLYSGNERIRHLKEWTIGAWPNVWEAPLALDGNLVTDWRSRQPVKGGMYLEIQLDRPRDISSVLLFSRTSRPGAIEFSGAGHGTRLHRLGLATGLPVPLEYLRIEATLAMRNAGYSYLLVPTGGGGYAPLGNAIEGQESAWGLDPAGYAGRFRLLRIK